MPQPTAHCHKKLRSVAQAAAAELYETLMGGSNDLFSEWKRQNPGLSDKALRNLFVAKNWGRCLPFARATLATMLAPANIKRLDSSTADEIMEVLRLDASLIRGRGARGQVMGLD